MERGTAEREILILGPDGTPVPDVLYRPPVELWDREVRALTILLDPGRLKRGVGPNRMLGPPLSAGRSYALTLGAGLTNVFGCGLSNALIKRFHIGAAVRTPVSLTDWTTTAPQAGSRYPLIIDFARILDRAGLFDSIIVSRPRGDRVPGRVATDHGETRWLFTPERPWVAGAYDIQVDPLLEDVCGNNLIAPFDRPISAGREQTCGVDFATMSFNVAS